MGWDSQITCMHNIRVQYVGEGNLKSEAKPRSLSPHLNRPLTDLMYIGIATIPACGLL